MGEVAPDLRATVSVVPMISEEDIGRRLREVGEEISRDFSGRDLLAVGILTGAFMVMADLIRLLTVPSRCAFVKVSSYGRGTETRGPSAVIPHFEEESPRGRDVLVVEDIVDTGLTLEAVLKVVRAEQPRSVRVFSLLDKPARRRVKVQIDYVGFTIPNRFVVGYGIDLAGHYRDLSHIAYVQSPR